MPDARDRALFRDFAFWTQRIVLALALVILLPSTMLMAGNATLASAAPDDSGFDFWVDSSMGPIKSRVFRAADGNTDRVVYALDGMRARDDLNGWEIETDVPRRLADQNINVVMPVGGQSSFYTDWRGPSTFLGIPAGSLSISSGSGATQAFSAGPGKSNTYKWETFLSQDLRNALRDRLGFNTSRNGVFGLSMGASAALALAADHPDQFSFAGAFSGYLSLTGPGMLPALRLAMLDAGGYNLDCMVSSIFDPKWQRVDPFLFAPTLIANKTRLWVSSSNGLPTSADGFSSDTFNGMALESLALSNTRTFQIRMNMLRATNITYDFPAAGIHNWKNWQDEATRMIPDLSANIG
ncbi:alpha/beta hydrolase [Nocardia sp. NPDC059240]|uniref:alpha/beta hydrolase n=1 Tax=Nocardia sp. NPDC059240 TaxID=3346786 RepID=UPI00367481A9